MTGAPEAAPGDAATDSVQELTDEIERTRAELGDTVGALAAKADMKARAQEKAADARQTIMDNFGLEARVAAVIGAVLVVGALIVWRRRRR
jgi:Protein of unknown function (DUF3618)